MKHVCEPELLTQLKDLTLQKLRLHFLKHQNELDEEQAVIFDTLNGDRTPMQPLDHVRNSIFVRIQPKATATKLYKDVWEPLEARILESKPRRMNSETLFLYDYIISRGEKKGRESINASRGAVLFGKLTADKDSAALEQFIRDDFSHSMALWPVAVGTTDEAHIPGRPIRFDDETIHLIRSIYELTEGPATPAVLLYLSNYSKGQIHDQVELRRLLHLIEAYVARNILAGRALNPLRRRFIDVLAGLAGSSDINRLKESLARDWPSNKEIMEYAVNDESPYYEDVRPLALGAILRGIENKLSGERWLPLGKGDNDYQVEHIYPQSGKQWVRDLREWKENKSKMDERVHMLGNLTLVTAEHNKKVGSEPFRVKRDYPKREGVASLRLNTDSWLREKTWGVSSIEKRTVALIKAALEYWKLA